MPASLGLHRLMLERFCKLFHVHQLAQGWTTRHCVLPQHYCCIMRCVVCVWKYLTTIYHFIIAAFTQNHDSTHSSSCQHKTRSQHGATLTQPLFMPSYSSTCPVNIPKLLFAKDPFIVNLQLYPPTVIKFVMTFATRSMYCSHFHYTSLRVDICRHTP